VGEAHHGERGVVHHLPAARDEARAEPIGERRQDAISVIDIRAEKRLRFGSKARAAVFVDVFNLTNSNTAVNINWRGGTAFERATTVLGPRIAKAGVKFDW
jgi:hypothetical protein